MDTLSWIKHMDLDFTKVRARTAEHVMFREVDGEGILLNLNTEHYFGLDQVGTRMWIVLNESDTLAAAVNTLLQEYEVEPLQLEADLRELIDQLVSEGLLELHGHEVA
jgi:hypothetical protein